MSRVYIVTGANGHLGRNLIECLLKAEQEVHALILPGEQMPHFPNEYLMDVVEGNVCDIKSMIPLFADTEGKEIVLIHAAAIIDIRSNVSPLTYQVNVVGTKNVVQLALQYRVYRYLHVSSVHAIPEPKVNKLIRETKFFSPQKVHGGYAKTKAAVGDGGVAVCGINRVEADAGAVDPRVGRGVHQVLVGVEIPVAAGGIPVDPALEGVGGPADGHRGRGAGISGIVVGRDILHRRGNTAVAAQGIEVDGIGRGHCIATGITSTIFICIRMGRLPNRGGTSSASSPVVILIRGPYIIVSQRRNC